MKTMFGGRHAGFGSAATAGSAAATIARTNRQRLSFSRGSSSRTGNRPCSGTNANVDGMLGDIMSVPAGESNPAGGPVARPGEWPHGPASRTPIAVNPARLPRPDLAGPRIGGAVVAAGPEPRARRGRRAGRAQRGRRAPVAAALRPEGEAGHLPVHVRRPVAPGDVRPQAEARRDARQADAGIVHE